MHKITNLSTIIPARIACATLLNFGLSDGRRLIVDIDRVNVIANQSRTSFGTESGSISDNAPSSSSISLLKYKIFFFDIKRTKLKSARFLFHIET